MMVRFGSGCLAADGGPCSSLSLLVAGDADDDVPVTAARDAAVAVVTGVLVATGLGRVGGRADGEAFEKAA